MIGEKVKLLREEREWTLTKLSDIAGVSKAYISQIENEPAKKVSAEILFKIAEALDTTMAVLMGRDVPVRNEADIPESLKIFANDNKLHPDVVKMLAGINYRGKQPNSPKDWAFIHNTIKNAVEYSDKV